MHDTVVKKIYIIARCNGGDVISIPDFGNFHSTRRSGNSNKLLGDTTDLLSKDEKVVSNCNTNKCSP